jgi:hypothetical protein
MIAAALGRLRALVRRLNVLARLEALEVQETETMAQIDELRAANARLTEVVTKMLAVVGSMKDQRDTATSQNADLQSKLSALEATEDMQAVIDSTHALADQIEAELPAMV